MISCVDFIPAYSVLFQYIEEKEGYEGVKRYWEYISDKYVEPSLGKQVKEHGLKGCWNYWSHSLNEEAADFTMEYDPDERTFTIDMHHCPSKGRLLSLEHMKPYENYCFHCDTLYRRVLERHGFSYEFDFSNTNHAACIIRVRSNEEKEPSLPDNNTIYTTLS